VNDFFEKTPRPEPPRDRLPRSPSPVLRQTKLNPSMFKKQTLRSPRKQQQQQQNRIPQKQTPLKLFPQKESPLKSPERRAVPTTPQPLTPRTSPAVAKSRAHVLLSDGNDGEEPCSLVVRTNEPVRRRVALPPPSPSNSQSDSGLPEEAREGHDLIRQILLSLSDDDELKLQVTKRKAPQQKEKGPEEANESLSEEKEEERKKPRKRLRLANSDNLPVRKPRAQSDMKKRMGALKRLRRKKAHMSDDSAEDEDGDSSADVRSDGRGSSEEEEKPQQRQKPAATTRGRTLRSRARSPEYVPVELFIFLVCLIPF